MEIYAFKTNINCHRCVALVKGHLEGNADIHEWSADVNHPDKLFTIESSLSPDSIQQLLQEAGFEATLIENKPKL